MEAGGIHLCCEGGSSVTQASQHSGSMGRGQTKGMGDPRSSINLARHRLQQTHLIQSELGIKIGDISHPISILKKSFLIKQSQKTIAKGRRLPIKHFGKNILTNFSNQVYYPAIAIWDTNPAHSPCQDSTRHTEVSSASVPAPCCHTSPKYH